MGVGSAYAAGFNATRKQQRSFMPAVNTLSSIIAQRKKSQGGGRMARVGGRIQNAEDRADEFFGRIEAREEKAYQRSQADMAQRQAEEKEARDVGLMEAEETRRQEAHDLQMAEQQQKQAQGAETFERKGKVADRAEAYEMVKQGLMMRDSKTVNAALQMMVPEGARGEDVITEGEPVDGARSFKGRPPAAPQTPQFIFDPDSDVVGVMFPGQEKPTVFKNAEQAFQKVLAPMNPAHEKSKDQITEAKNTREAKFKEKKLTADIHKDAHEAAMQQFEFDGYYQPASYDKNKYDAAYTDYVARATGQAPNQIEPPPEPTDEEKEAKAGGQDFYSGSAAPKGIPGAKRGKDGRWYVKKGKKWYPVLKGKKKKGKAPKLKTAGVPGPKGSIGDFGSKSQPRGVITRKPTGKVVRKKIPSRITAGEGWSG